MHLIVNAVYANNIVVEVKIAVDEKPITYYANEFMDKLICANTAIHFR